MRQRIQSGVLALLFWATPLIAQDGDLVTGLPSGDLQASYADDARTTSGRDALHAPCANAHADAGRADEPILSHTPPSYRFPVQAALFLLLIAGVAKCCGQQSIRNGTGYLAVYPGRALALGISTLLLLPSLYLAGILSLVVSGVGILALPLWIVGVVVLGICAFGFGQVTTAYSIGRRLRKYLAGGAGESSWTSSVGFGLACIWGPLVASEWLILSSHGAWWGEIVQGLALTLFWGSGIVGTGALLGGQLDPTAPEPGIR